MVSVLAFHSDDPSSNPAEAFSAIFCSKSENKQKRPGLAHFFLKK